MTQKDQIIPSLDGIRAVSIGIVFIAHAGWSNIVPGGFGVTVFFFLSGFLITTLLMREYDETGQIGLRNFYLRRLIRLMPPLLATVAGAFVLAQAGFAAGEREAGTLLSQLAFYYNYYSLLPGIGGSLDGFDVLWSLSVEEHFYLIWPSIFLLIAMGRLSLRYLVGFLMVVLLWRGVRFEVFEHSEWMLYISTDTRIDSLLYGCLLALMARDGLARRVFSERAIVRLPLIAIALILLLLSFGVRDEVFRATLRYSLQGLALMPLFHYAVTRPKDWMFAWLNWSLVRRIGVYSYTIYLSHFVIIIALAQVGFSKVPGALIALVASLVWAGLVHHLLERPLKPLRERFSHHRPCLQAADPVQPRA